MKTKTLLTLTCASLLSIGTSAQFDGTQDTAFGSNGKVSFDYGSNLANESLSESFIDKTNNVIYTLGSYVTGANKSNALITAHSSVDGSVVKEFGGKGYVSFDPLIGATDLFLAGAVQADGKVLAVGSTIGGSIDMIVARFGKDGALDQTFNFKGFAIIDGGGTNGADVLYDIAVQSDGKIIICGVAQTANGFDSYVARLNTDGSFDGTFGNAGKVFMNLGTNEQFYTLTLLSDGNIMLGGNADANYSLVMLDKDGKLTGYSVDGKALAQVNSKESRIVKIMESSDGKLLIVGQTNDPTDGEEMFITKQSMNGNGLVNFAEGAGTLSPELDSNDKGDTVYKVYDAELMADGRVMIVGAYDDGFNTTEAGIYMVNADGTLDKTWGTEGFRRYGSGNGKALETPNIEQDVDGNILMSFRNYNASFDFNIIKLLKEVKNDNVSVSTVASNLNTVNAYPNPTTSMLYIDIASTENTNATITIVDVTGKIFTTQEVSLTTGDNTVYLANEVSALKTGYYFITIATTKGSETIKLLKQ